MSERASVAAGGRVVVVGSLNVDLVARVDRLPRAGETVSGSDLDRLPGGKGLNQAVAAARAGVPVAMIGSVGDDDHGSWLGEVAAGEGIDVSGVVRVERPTGTALITVGGGGANTIVVSPGANGETGPGRLGPRDLAPADLVLCQAETPSASVTGALRAARAAGSRTIVNQAPFRPLDREQWGLIEILVVNESELAGLLRSVGSGSRPPEEDASADRARADATAAARELLAGGPGPSTMVVSLGRHGAVAVSVDGSVASAEPRPVAAVDTVGAGDCLTGWLAAGLLQGLPIGSALERSVRAASVAVQREGAAAAMPTLAEVDDGR